MTHKKLKVYEGDISDLDPIQVLEDLGLEPGEVDLLAGGPPCQSFSTAGRRQTTQDPRGTLLWQYLRFVEVMRPKFFLMENVRGLVSAALKHRPIAQRPDKGGPPLGLEEEQGSVIRLLAEDLQRFKGKSYHMDCFEVNAVNYGAPQIRERALFIGNRFNDVVEFIDPTHGQIQQNTSGQPTLFTENPKQLHPWRTLRDAIGDLDEKNPVVLDFSPRKKSLLDMVPEGSNWRSLPEEVQRESMGRAWHAKGGRSGWWRRLTYDLPSPTLVTMPNHASTSLCHPTKNRALSLREYSRIQEFPDDWLIEGRVTEQYAQVGNAVPIRLGSVAGEVIAARLDHFRARVWKPASKAPEDYRIVYIQSHIRTRKWFKDGEVLVWNNGKQDAAAYGIPKTVRRSKLLS